MSATVELELHCLEVDIIMDSDDMVFSSDNSGEPSSASHNSSAALSPEKWKKHAQLQQSVVLDLDALDMNAHS
ncbi:hypothetical protein AeRB84_010797 [Aphanomyces euteiches]|nr:hypothetical protein AeRB84_010797 [Aphanomyces euteiches]